MSPSCEDAEAGWQLYDAQQEARDKLEAAVGKSSYKTDVQQHLVNSYADLQYDRLLGRECIQSIKDQLVTPLISKVKDEVFRLLAKPPAAQQSLEAQIVPSLRCMLALRQPPWATPSCAKHSNPSNPSSESSSTGRMRRARHRAVGAAISCTMCPSHRSWRPCWPRTRACMLS